MKPRKLTLQSETRHRLYRQSSRIYPSLKLSGKWLKDCGFSPQDKVQVTVNHEVLIIELIKD
ncbi:SymE family type I addiction module toxin [Flavivirga aquatica]|nr:SymE family type I addiction module toxin [Flavivirga aquatica]